MLQICRNAGRMLFSSLKSTSVTQTAGLKVFPPPKEIGEIEYPERRKLRVIEKVPQFPPGLRAPTMQKRLRYMRGPENVHNFLMYRQYGIMATIGGRLKHNHFEMIRMKLLRNLDQDRMFAIWRVDAPWQPVTKKGTGHRMGGGKGSIDHYVTPIKAGRIIIEVGGTCEYFEVKRVLERIASILPFKAMAVSQEILDQKEAKENWLEENNDHLWTWKYMVKNNMIGCHKWISPSDKKWFNKHL
ncbi:39S ribosomal protein L16, mitochondrial [Odontomachus brunneus]|uniref:39S ribosomal protein L16, mitochondrial n=1 Tax=Odontomachus brunneus TaxID=486640 RepID=UPI0013F228F6|nr:39S ribosomal protein L16, mitochondrial [Odontomachus brunneus]XP_032683259.1 39S ribosomal protein L16, mitochondrial [Odontomachus brunneus]XP_032683260.1 39S ribosomal protein L16, mitochondrial [Odontomachus brunneus]